jgi:uncharacterized protein (DUF1330 family)
MEIKNELYPVTDEQLAAMTEPGPAGPIVMVNLLKFREQAAYEDGSDRHLTGREAYQRYAAAVGKLIRMYGGRFIFAGDVTHLMIGQTDEMWDEVALAEYPDRAAFMSMLQAPAFQAASHHRVAGLEGQLNIETTWIPVLRPKSGLTPTPEGSG